MTGRPGGGGMENMCYRILLAAACVDESDHLALVNAGDEEIVSQEEGEEVEGRRGRRRRVLLRERYRRGATLVSHTCTCRHTGRAVTVRSMYAGHGTQCPPSDHSHLPPRACAKHFVPSARHVLIPVTSCGAIRAFSKLLQPVRH